MAIIPAWQGDPASLCPARFTPDEWQLRLQLAACYRIFDLLGWTELIYNHITLRLPGPERLFLINPFGLHYREVTASNLVTVDLEGRIVGPSDWPVNPAGFVLHSAIHEALPDAHCVMHIHTTAGMAVACLRDGLTDTNFYSVQLKGQVAYHPFEGITVNPDEKQRIVTNLGNRHCLILRNHGLLSHGVDVAHAFAYLWTLNRACEIQLASQGMGELLQIPAMVAAQATEQAFQFRPEFGAGWDMFNALVRQVDARDPSYRR